MNCPSRPAPVGSGNPAIPDGSCRVDAPERSTRPTDAPMTPRARPRTTAAPPAPEVKRLVATVRQHGAENTVHESVHGDGSGNEIDIPIVVRCVNPDCRGGGYRLRSFVEAMRAARLAEQTWSAACRGRANGRSAHRGEPCPNHAEVAVRLDYAGP